MSETSERLSAPSPHPVSSSAFWRCYWTTARPYLFFVSGASGWVGLNLGERIPAFPFIAAFAAFFLSYGLGQALTDVSQRDTDSISSPYRPLTRGLIAPRQVLTVSLAGLAACGAIFVWRNPWNLLPSVLAVAGLATYTPLKRRPWGGPPWNSWIVALLPLMGALCGARDPMEALALPGLLPAMGSVFFSYAIFVLLGYFKDISADRATGYRTLPVVAGWKPSILVSAAFAAVAIACSLALQSTVGADWSAGGWAGRALAAAGAALLAYAHLSMWRTRSESEAHGPIAQVVRGYVLLHVGEAVCFAPSQAAFAALFLIAFEAAIATRPERSQV